SRSSDGDPSLRSGQALRLRAALARRAPLRMTSFHRPRSAAGRWATQDDNFRPPRLCAFPFADPAPSWRPGRGGGPATLEVIIQEGEDGAVPFELVLLPLEPVSFVGED